MNDTVIFQQLAMCVITLPVAFLALSSPCSVLIHKLFWIVKLNLLRLCGEKTIFKLFIFETAEYQLSLSLTQFIVLLVVAGFHRVLRRKL